MADDKTRHEITIVREPGAFYAQADSTLITSSMTGYFEIAFIAARQRAVSQSFDIIATDAEGMSLGNPKTTAIPLLMELGVIRMTPEISVETATTLLRHAVSMGHSKEAILGLLRTKGIID